MTTNEANHCFVCGAANASGLHVKFRIEDDFCVGEFTPGDHLVGWDGLVHGGILYALLDDVMANWIFLRGMQAVTARCEIRYRAPLPVNIPIRMEAQQVERRGRYIRMAGRIFLARTSDLIAEAQAKFMLQSK